MKKSNLKKNTRIGIKLLCLGFMITSLMGLTACYSDVEGFYLTNCTNIGQGQSQETGLAPGKESTSSTVKITSPDSDCIVEIEEGDSVTLVVEVESDSDRYVSDWIVNGISNDNIEPLNKGKGEKKITIHNVTWDMDNDEYYLAIWEDADSNLKNSSPVCISYKFTLKVVEPGTGKWYGGASYDGSDYDDNTIQAKASILDWEGNRKEFEKNDQIFMFVWTGNPEEVPARLVVDGVINTYNGSWWEAVPQMLWTDMTSEHYFLAVSSRGNITDFKADSYKLPMTEKGYVENKEADILAAIDTQGTKYQKRPIELTFKHLMAKLVVNFDLEGKFEKAPSLVLEKGYKDATIDYLKGSVTGNEETRTNISLQQEERANEEYEMTYSSLLIPDENVKLKITIDGHKYTYSDISLKGGEVTTVNLTWDNLKHAICIHCGECTCTGDHSAADCNIEGHYNCGEVDHTSKRACGHYICEEGNHDVLGCWHYACQGGNHFLLGCGHFACWGGDHTACNTGHTLCEYCNQSLDIGTHGLCEHCNECIVVGEHGAGKCNN